MSSRFSKDSDHPPDAASAEILDAEQLLQSGKTLEAMEFANRLEGRHDFAAELQLKSIVGRALFEQGKISEAIDVLQQVFSASQNLPPQQQFTAAFNLFSRESQFQSPDETLPLLSRLRQLAPATGEVTSIAGLHLLVARLEATRGHCVNARRHVEACRRLMASAGKGSGFAAIDLVDSGLELYAGNLGRAVNAARGGVDNAQISGQCMPLAGSLTNLGMLFVYTGHGDRARAVLDRAFEHSEGLALVRFAILDAFVQLGLLRDDLKSVDENLKKCSAALAEHRAPSRSWYDLAHQLTRCAFYERLEDWGRIVNVCNEVDDELSRRQFKALRTSSLCAKARALAHLGQQTSAEHAVAAAVKICPRGAVDPLIVLEATKGVCTTLRGEAAQGAKHFDRALAACRAIGHRYHEEWIDRAATRLATSAPESVSVARSQVDVTDAALLMTDVSAVLGAGHSIDLLSHRVTAILQATTMGGRVDVESESGCEFASEPTSTWEADEHGAFCIRLRGSDRRVVIRVDGVQTIDELSLLKSIADLAQAAVNRTADTETEDENQNLWPRAAVASAEDTIFRSPQMIEFLKIAARLASTDLPMLITGETGTGKDIIARLIHEYSKQARGPFVPFNCSAVPRDLVESQLFGHKRGAFTGALESSPGVIRAAERGTLFMDELGDLDTGTQPKLLRFLESGEVLPVGEVRTQRVHVRVIAATNANLDELVEQGRFRRDLFYRIGVARLSLPPLRDRKDEIPAFASLFLTRFSRECGRVGIRLGDDFIAALLLYDWPGNIRQLANEIRRAVAMAADGQTLRSTNLGNEIVERWNERPTLVAVPDPRGVFIRLDQDLARATAELEQRFIAHALASAGGRVADAAQLLGLSRKGLFLKRRRRGLLPN